MKKTVLFSCLLVTTMGFAQGQEDFNATAPVGWVISNQSSPIGSSAWQQAANTNVFAAHQGATGVEYFFANFNSTSGTGTICDFLIAPANVNGTLKFWTRSTIAQDGVTIYPDRMTVRYSPTGGVNTGTCINGNYGDFTTELVTVNAGLVNQDYPAGYPVNAWTEFSAGIPGTTGRVAFIYDVPNGGPNGSNSNYIGLDSVSWTGDLIFANGFEVAVK